VAAEHGHFNPLHQFQIEELVPIHIGGLNASFTNSALWMVIGAAVLTSFLTLAMRERSLVPGKLQSMAELSYEFVAKMVRDNVGDAGKPFFPFIFTLFMFILTANVIGLMPGAFTVTSHIIVTFGLAVVVFIGVTAVGFIKNGVGFLRNFAPSGVPIVMLIVLIPIETFSYFVRPISLSVRLFANMMAGHTLLKVFGSFVVALGYIGGWAPLLFVVAFTGLEFLVAFLQAFVFAVLTCVYLNDALHTHH
jgi:F-type H+-transporting ATPase subunit a